MTRLRLLVTGVTLLSSAACIQLAPPTLFDEAGGGGLGPGGAGATGGDDAGNGGGPAAPPVCSSTVGEPCVRVVAITAGRSSTCARFDDGSLRCWGGNDAGQLGLASRPSSAFEPPTPSDLPSFDDIVMGDVHGCGLKDGTVSCWGNNAVGQLGVVGPNTPVAQPLALGGEALELATRNFTTCARGTDQLWCWGLDLDGQNPWPPGEAGTYSPPTAVAELDGVAIDELGVARNHACVRIDDEVRCWGRGEFHRLGTGNQQNQLTPTPVLKTYPSPVHRLAVGHEFGCVIAGTPAAAYCWGYFNAFHSHASPTAYAGWLDLPYRDVQLGFRIMCVLYQDGSVRCAGTNGSGLIPLTEEDDEPLLLAVPDLGTVTQISLGRFHACALDTDGEVNCWGRNSEGELGRGYLSAQELPGPVVWEGIAP
ncbi:MAG: hypothetical protein KC731_09950 [Myxococcales bacterium]|nr:hypothetical protein [Myxococcales bacterium]